MSTQQLADRCVELGMEIPRSVISNFENGRRSGIGVDELIILARALGLPPVFLLAPIAYVEQVEVLPGDMRTAVEAAEWIAGDAERRWPPPGGEGAPIESWSQYHIVHYERSEIWRIQQLLDTEVHDRGYLDRLRKDIPTKKAESEEARARADALRAELDELVRGMPELAPASDWQRLLDLSRAAGEAASDATRAEERAEGAEDHLRRMEAIAVDYPRAVQDSLGALKALREAMRKLGMVVSAVTPELAELLEGVPTE